MVVARKSSKSCVVVVTNEKPKGSFSVFLNLHNSEKNKEALKPLCIINYLRNPNSLTIARYLIISFFIR